MKRICTVATCVLDGSKRCCADCSEKGCKGRCLNHPSRCGVWAKPGGPIGRGRKQTYDREQVLALVASGMKHADVAEAVGCAISTVSDILRREARRRERSE